MEPVYKANDGNTFQTPEECEKRNYFLNARREFDEAFDRLRTTALLELKTADGEFLQSPTRWNDFYIVTGEWFSSHPTIERVSIYLRSVTHFEVADDGRICVYFRSGVENPRQFWLNELYAHKHNAEQKLKEVLQDRIKQYRQQIKEIEVSRKSI